MTHSRADFEQACAKIFETDKNVRFAGIINKMGKLVAGGMRKGLEPMESSQDSERLYLDFALRTAMRHDFDQDFGKVIYTLSERERITFVSIPLKEHLVLVSIESGKPYSKVIKNSLKLFGAIDG